MDLFVSVIGWAYFMNSQKKKKRSNIEKKKQKKIVYEKVKYYFCVSVCVFV